MLHHLFNTRQFLSSVSYLHIYYPGGAFNALATALHQMSNARMLIVYARGLLGSYRIRSPTSSSLSVSYTQAIALASGVPQYIYDFHRYTLI